MSASYHRHAYPTIGDQEFYGAAVLPDGHAGPCENPRAVLVLDPRQPATFKALQRALDDQPGLGLRSLVHAVESLLAEAVA